MSYRKAVERLTQRSGIPVVSRKSFTMSCEPTCTPLERALHDLNIVKEECVANQDFDGAKLIVKAIEIIQKSNDDKSNDDK